MLEVGQNSATKHADPQRALTRVGKCSKHWTDDWRNTGRLSQEAPPTRYPAAHGPYHDCSQPLHQRCHQEAGGRCGVNGHNARSGQTPRRCRPQRRRKSSQDCDSATQKAHPTSDCEMEGRAEGETQGAVYPWDRPGSGHTQRNREEVHSCRKPTHGALAQRRKYPSLLAWQSTRRTFSLDTWADIIAERRQTMWANLRGPSVRLPCLALAMTSLRRRLRLKSVSTT